MHNLWVIVHQKTLFFAKIFVYLKKKVFLCTQIFN